MATKAATNSPIQAFGPLLSVVVVHVPDTQLREMSSEQGMEATAGRARSVKATASKRVFRGTQILRITFKMKMEDTGN